MIKKHWIALWQISYNIFKFIQWFNCLHVAAVIILQQVQRFLFEKWMIDFFLFGLPIITHAYGYLKHSIKNRQWFQQHLRRNTPWDRRKETERKTLKGSALEAATVPSCLITPCPCPVCCSWSPEQHCSISIRWSLPPRLRPLCLWKWYSTGMPSCMPRCHCLSSSLAFICVYECLCGECWLTSFIYNYVGVFFEVVYFKVKCVFRHKTCLFCSLCVCVNVLLLFLCDLWLTC